jgi:hypothetical protein
MKFTKAEEQILSLKHEKYEKVLLWLGICCLCLSFALIPYEISRVKKLKSNIGKAETFVEQEIRIQTKYEKILHSALRKSMAINTDLWGLYEKRRSYSLIFFYFLIWLFFSCNICPIADVY